MEITKETFGQLNDQTIYAYTMKNKNNIEVVCLNYGCVITKLMTPDADGNLENIVLGFDCIEDYIDFSPYFGAVIGRVAGRIANAEFELDGKTYKLAQNDQRNHLHGGIRGFSHVVWDTKVIENENDARSIEFTYASPDGEEGYPGNVTVKVIYTLNDQNELLISYEGTTEQKTLLNLTNHTYFNLGGNLKRDILDHTLNMKSDRFVELREDLIPTGNFLDVENTVFDFRKGRKIKDGVNSDHIQNSIAGGGYDHPFLLNTNNDQEVILYDEESGRCITIETDQPDVVLYTGSQLEDDYSMRGVQSRKYLGLCLETQGLPDAIHHPRFPSGILDKGEVYRSITKYTFGVK
ncbi:aldose epimerase family protein [Bacillus songklensis]|uniref:Aldose 1-epimerase n=1 Tax=Bacillus songklensis TaxID=1069116 RepID=A0ABV8B2I9_9BACI